MSRQHNSNQLKSTINAMVALSDKILQFSLKRAKLEQISTIEGLIEQVKTYGESIGVEEYKLYRIHYDLYIKLFLAHTDTILKNPDDEGDLDDTWIRKNKIEFEVGSNLNKPTGIIFPLSHIYNNATEIYKRHYKDNSYTEECSYVDQFMLYLYRIFNSFKWDNQENQQLGKLINHINKNNLRIVPRTIQNNNDISNILDMAPQLIRQLTTGLAGGSQKLEHIKEVGETAGQLLGDPNVKNMINTTISGIKEDMNKSGGDMNTFLNGLMSRFSDTGFTDELKQSVEKHVNTKQEVKIKTNQKEDIKEGD